MSSFKALRVMTRACHGHASNRAREPIVIWPICGALFAWGGVFGFIAGCEFMTGYEQRRGCVERTYGQFLPDSPEEKECAKQEPACVFAEPIAHPSPPSGRVSDASSKESKTPSSPSKSTQSASPPGYIHAKMQAPTSGDGYQRTQDEQNRYDAAKARNECRREGCTREMHMCDALVKYVGGYPGEC